LLNPASLLLHVCIKFASWLEELICYQEEDVQGRCLRLFLSPMLHAKLNEAVPENRSEV